MTNTGQRNWQGYPVQSTIWLMNWKKGNAVKDSLFLIAYELRTPLTYLQGSIEAILDGVWKPDREHFTNCHEEIMRITRLIQDLNTLTNLEWENITFNKTDLLPDLE
jgi:signal transduction histidine kinase